MPNTSPSLQTYLVGGAVRDLLLGLPPGDRDYVVVGANIQTMLDAGYTPVGKDFPVFLHPKTHCEYALARTERKSGHGYAGFTVYASPDVTLEQDLYRRDLTINAIAQDSQGRIIDPYNGQADLKHKLLRHVSPAFAEDPLRILRAARFAARFTDFNVAPETLQLMRAMVHAGETHHLVAERVWQELSRGLMEAQPHRMFEVLDACGALAVLFPELKALEHTGEYTQALHRVTVLCSLNPSPAPALPARWASLCMTMPDTANLHKRLRIPLACKDLANLAHTTYQSIHNSHALSMEDTLHLLMRCDALRKPERFNELLTVCQAHWLSIHPKETTHYAPIHRLPLLLTAAQHVKGDAVMARLALQDKQSQSTEIAQAMFVARVQAMSDIAPIHIA